MSNIQKGIRLVRWRKFLSIKKKRRKKSTFHKLPNGVVKDKFLSPFSSPQLRHAPGSALLRFFERTSSINPLQSACDRPSCLADLQTCSEVLHCVYHGGHSEFTSPKRTRPLLLKWSHVARGIVKEMTTS